MKNRYRIIEKSKEHFYLQSLRCNLIILIAEKLGLNLWEYEDQSFGEIADAKDKFKKTIDRIESYPKYYKL